MNWMVFFSQCFIKKMEPNTIYHKEIIIAHHTYDDITGWKIVLNEELTKEGKEKCKEIIKNMAKRNEIKVWFEDEK